MAVPPPPSPQPSSKPTSPTTTPSPMCCFLSGVKEVDSPYLGTLNVQALVQIPEVHSADICTHIGAHLSGKTVPTNGTPRVQSFMAPCVVPTLSDVVSPRPHLSTVLSQTH
jgi:hypothetical protein